MTTGAMPLFIPSPQTVRVALRPSMAFSGWLLLLLMVLHLMLPLAAQAGLSDSAHPLRLAGLSSQSPAGGFKSQMPTRSERHDHAELPFYETETEKTETLLALLPETVFSRVSDRFVPVPDYHAPGPAAVLPFTERHHAPVFVFLQVFRL